MLNFMVTDIIFFAVLFSLIGPKKGQNRPHSGWNIFMWVSLFLGNGLLMCLYSQEWFASKNCPRDMVGFDFNSSFFNLKIFYYFSNKILLLFDLFFPL